MSTLLKKKLRLCTVIFNGFAVLVASTLVNAATLTFETIALEGDSIPGAPVGTTFGFFNSVASLNNQGEVALNTILTGAGVAPTNNQAIFSNAGGTSSLVVREGDIAPVSEGSVFFSALSFSDPALNSQGEITFQADLTGDGVNLVNNRAIFTGGTGALSLVARTGDAVPGAEGTVLFTFNSISLNDQGEVAFGAVLTNAEGMRGVNSRNNEGIFSNVGSTLSLLVREGDTAPGAGEGVFFVSLGDPALNNQGQIAFVTDLDGPSVTNPNDSAIFSDFEGELSIVVRAGDTAPVAGEGVYFDSFSNPALNDQGEIAFQAALEGDGVTFSNRQAIFSDVGGTLSLVVREGDAAPGTQDGVFFDFLADPVLNNQGDVFIEANLTGPGLGFGDTGIFVKSDGELSLLLLEGDIIDFGDGDLATINALTLSNNGFNDLGQIAFFATLSDGRSGMFLATPDGIVAPVPLPAALPLMASGLLGLVMIARRRRSAQA